MPLKLYLYVGCAIQKCWSLHQSVAVGGWKKCVCVAAGRVERHDSLRAAAARRARLGGQRGRQPLRAEPRRPRARPVGRPQARGRGGAPAHPGRRRPHHRRGPRQRRPQPVARAGFALLSAKRVFAKHCFAVSGDHFYKTNASLPLKDQMISCLPDIIVESLSSSDEFIVVACDGIWFGMLAG